MIQYTCNNKITQEETTLTVCLKSESSTSKLDVSVGLLTSGINGAVTKEKKGIGSMIIGYQIYTMRISLYTNVLILFLYSLL